MSVKSFAFISVLFMIYLFFEREERQDHKLKKKYDIAFAFLMFLLIILGYSVSSGLFQCGYHLVDDHEFYVMQKDINTVGLWTAVGNYLQKDIFTRFRPTYCISRVLLVSLFGTNFVQWHIFMAVFSALSMTLCYTFARKMRCPVWLSFIFPIAIYGGQQMSVLWRLGPQENFGIALVMATLIALIGYIENRKKGNLIVFIVFTVLLGGIKEAFVLLLPLIPLWCVYYECTYFTPQDLTKDNLLKSLKRNKLVFAIVYFLFFLCIGIILLRVGTSYAFGGSEKVDYIQYLWVTFTYYLKWYLLISIVGAVLLLWVLMDAKRKKEEKIFISFLKRMLFPAFMLAYILLSQLVLHSGMGLIERYIIPTSLGFAVFWIIDLYNYLKEKEIKKEIYHVFYFIVAIVFILRMVDSYDFGDYITEGYHTTNMLSKIGEYAAEDPDVLVCCEYEHDYSASVYLEEVYSITNVYNMNFSQQTVPGEAIDGYGINENNTMPINDADIILAYVSNIDSLRDTYNINFEDYNIYNYGQYVVYIGKHFDTSN